MTEKQSYYFKLLVPLVIATVAFFITFLSGSITFWIKMSCTGVILVTLSFLFDYNAMILLFKIKDQSIKQIISWGLGSAIILYGIFFIGNIIAPFFIPIASNNIVAVYQYKTGLPIWGIILCIGFIIGPAEEIFWRGYLQRILFAKYKWLGVAITTIAYTLVHLPTGNLMLLGAALVCGTLWGALFAYKQSLWINIISHVIWDLSVFIFFPFN